MKTREEGMLTLELAFVLPIFIVFFLGINGLFAVVRAQNHMTHALIQATKSLSMDSYMTSSLDGEDLGGTFTIEENLSDQFLAIGSHKKNYLSSASLNSQSAKDRFIGYLEPNAGLQEKKLR